MVESVLEQLGVGVLTNGIYDLLRTLAAKGTSLLAFHESVQDCINVHGASIKAETIISALAKNGILRIDGSQLEANQALIFGSEGGTAKITGSTLKTATTTIEVGAEAQIDTSGHAQIRQNADGSISFHV